MQDVQARREEPRGGDEVGNENQPPIRPAYPKTLQSMTKNRDHPLRMKLLWDEYRWARRIKHAIEANRDLDNLSDFMYAQMALRYSSEETGDYDPEEADEEQDDAQVEQDETDHALQVAVSKADALQEYRREYGIVESYEDGCRALRRMARLYPGFFLSFDFDPDQGIYVLAADMAQFDSSVCTTDGFNAFFVGYYYICHALCPDLQSIHRGFIVLIECKGMGWNRKKELKVWHKLVKQLHSVYPKSPQSARHYNAGAVVNVIGCAVKKLLPKEEAAKLEFGLQCEASLDSIYLVPDVETATQRLITQMEAALRLRFQNESRFSLDDPREIVPFLDDDELEAVFDARV